MKYLLVISLALLCISAKAQVVLGESVLKDSSTTTLTSKLGLPFGEIAKLKVEVIDGDKLRWKASQGIYLLKVNTINDRKITDTMLLRFTDETGTLANDLSSLYNLIYKKKTGSPSLRQMEKMEKKYVGKKLTVMAYETGQFKGTPDNYFDYTPYVPGVPHFFATTAFHFEHSLVIISNLKK